MNLKRISWGRKVADWLRLILSVAALAAIAQFLQWLETR